MNRAIFLDRDGVLNKSFVIEKKPCPPSTLEDLYILPKVPEALSILKKLSFKLIVVTNQPDVARGKQLESNVIKINKYLEEVLPLDKIYVCFHDNENNCNCRKPKPGMLYTASEELNLDLEKSYMIGDRWGDIHAGYTAKCTNIFIDYNYSEKQPTDAEYTYKCDDLYAAATWIKKRHKTI